MGKAIAIIVLILYILAAICMNASLYKALKARWKAKDWVFAIFCLFLFFVEILFALSLVAMFPCID